MFKIVGATVLKRELSFFERVKVFLRFKHPVEYIHWIDLPLETRIAIAEVTERVALDGIDTSDLDLYFGNNPDSIGTAFLTNKYVFLDRRFLEPGTANAMRFTLFHELRHFDQYRRYFLGVLSEGKTYWMGDTYQDRGAGYHFVEPWELDANAYAESKMTKGELDFPLYHRIKASVQEHDALMVVRY